MNKKEIERIISIAIEKGIDDYIISRKLMVPGFIDKNFSLKGTLKIHKKAIGKDLYKNPLNVFWSVPFLIIRTSYNIFEKMGKTNISKFLSKVPRGFQTDMENEIKWLVYTELLELPYEHSGKTSLKDALLESILCQKEITDLLEGYLSQIKNKSNNPAYRSTLEKNLKEYSSSRIAVSEIAASIITVATSYLTFNKVTPGVFSAGNVAAVTIAQQMAISNFWLGSQLGSIYYSVFPVIPSTGLIIASTGALMTALALITSFIGIITDPIQVKLGIHKKRLNKFIDMYKSELKGESKSKYKIKDHYLARVFDIIDLLKIAAKSI